MTPVCPQPNAWLHGRPKEDPTAEPYSSVRCGSRIGSYLRRLYVAGSVTPTWAATAESAVADSAVVTGATHVRVTIGNLGLGERCGNLVLHHDDDGVERRAGGAHRAECVDVRSDDHVRDGTRAGPLEVLRTRSQPDDRLE